MPKPSQGNTISIPPELQPFIVNCDADYTSVEFHLQQRGVLPLPDQKPIHDTSLPSPADIALDLKRQTCVIHTKMQSWVD